MLAAAALGMLLGCGGGESSSRLGVEGQGPHILLIVADDLNWDSVGVHGGPVEGLTPNIDALVREGAHFEHAFVNSSVCQPSRNVILSGRHGHRTGGDGFGGLTVPDLPLLPTVLGREGYRTCVMGKVQHSTPYGGASWDHAVDRVDLGMGRSPALFASEARAFMRAAVDADRPFFIMANSHDPHRPLHGFERASWRKGAKPVEEPSRTSVATELDLPAFLPDLPLVRRELAAYFDSVRRLDDTVGALLAAVEELGLRESTLVVFLSDNGMPFPFAKASCYQNGVRTPLVFRWPGTIQAGTVRSDVVVSAVDLLPTLVDLAGGEIPMGLDGRSLAPLVGAGIEGLEPVQSAGGWDHAFVQFGRTSNGTAYPMRAVQGRRFGYVFNAWSDGVKELVRAEHKANGSYQAMLEAAAEDPEVAERVAFLKYRTVEELYDYEADPHALRNLIDDPAHAETRNRLRAELEAWMERTDDPQLDAFRTRVLERH